MSTQLNLTKTVISECLAVLALDSTAINKSVDMRIENITVSGTDNDTVNLKLSLQKLDSLEALKIADIDLVLPKNSISIMENLNFAIKDSFENLYFNLSKDYTLIFECNKDINLLIIGGLYD